MRKRVVIRRIRQIVEKYLANLVYFVIPRLSRRSVLSLSRGLGWLYMRLDRRCRAVSLENLALAFGEDLGEEEKMRLLPQIYRTFTLTFLDLFWFSRNTGERLDKWVQLDESAREYRDKAPAIVITAHFGSWEAGGLMVSRHFSPLTSVAMPLINPSIDRMLNTLRTATGQVVVAREGALKKLITCLRKGGNVAILPDQNTLPEEGGVFVNFFGLPVPVTRAGAALAQRSGANIVFMFCLADESGVYKVYCRSEQTIDKADVAGCSETELTQRIIGVIESEIRRHPEAWLWLYKRWRFIPAGHSGEGFPSYTRRLSGSTN